MHRFSYDLKRVAVFLSLGMTFCICFLQLLTIPPTQVSQYSAIYPPDAKLPKPVPTPAYAWENNDLIVMRVSPSEGLQGPRTITANIANLTPVSAWVQVISMRGFTLDGNATGGYVIQTVPLNNPGGGIFSSQFNVSNYSAGLYYTQLIIQDATTVNTTIPARAGFYKGSDTQGPTIVSTSPSSDSFFQNTSVVFQGIIRDPSGITSASVNIYNTMNNLCANLTLFDDGNHGDYTLNDSFFATPTWLNASMPIGTYNYAVVAYDNSSAHNAATVNPMGSFQVTDNLVTNTTCNYTLANDTNYNWVPATTYLSTLSDYGYRYTTIWANAWDFQYYGTSYSSIKIARNGYFFW